MSYNTILTKSLFIQCIFNEGITIRQLAERMNISYFTVLKYYKIHCRITSIQSLIDLSKHVRDTKTLISHKSQNDIILLNQIKKQTKFLPPSTALRERLWYIENKTTTPPKCVECSINNVQWDKNLQIFSSFCSSRCLGLNTNIQNKKKQTNTKKRGTPFPAQHKEVKKKYHTTMEERYGTAYPNSSHILPETYQILNDRSQLSDLLSSRTTHEVGSKLGVSQSLISKFCTKHGIQNTRTVSIFQQNVQKEMQNICKDISIISNTRQVIPPKELDLFIPSLNIAIECNGVFWHGEKKGRDKKYHLEKTIQCEKQGIRLIHLYDTEWISKYPIVISRLSSILNKNTRIYARLCTIKEISSSEGHAFCQTSHIQGGVYSKHNYGLFFENVLVAVMTFSKSRYNKKYQYELVRYCSALGINVIGGAGKLFKAFIRRLQPESIISYCDRRWNTGGLYKTLNFKLLSNSKPNYHYFKPPSIVLYPRLKFQKHKLAAILNTFNPNKTEWENMQENDYDRIWDCGNQVFLYIP